MHKALHTRDGVEIFYVSRKEGRWFATTDDYVDITIQVLEDNKELKKACYCNQ